MPLSSVSETPRTFRPTTFIDTKKKAFADLDEAVRSSKDGPSSLDTEFDPKHYDPEQKPIIWSYSHRRGERKVVLGEFAETIYADWLTDRRFKKVYSDFGTEYKTFRARGLDLSANLFGDIVQLDFLVDENNKKHGLKEQVYRHLRRKRPNFKELFCYVPPGKKKPLMLRSSQLMGINPLPDDALATMSAEDWMKLFIEYSGDDGEDTFLLFHKHRKTVEDIGYWPNYQKIAIPFLKAVLHMEDAGILINVEGMEAIRTLARVDSYRAAHAFKSLVGRPDLNLNAKDQLRELLVGELEWPEYADMRTDKTDEQQMTKGAFQRWLSEGYLAADLVLRRETKNKLVKDTTSLLSGISEDGRLRTDINVVGAMTGRISSRKWTETIWVEKKVGRGAKATTKKVEKRIKVGANLLNIVGKGEKDPYGIRNQFVAPKKGQITARGTIANEDYELVVVDEAGFELVLAIEFASRVFKGSEMYAVMQKYGKPSAVHALTAIRILGAQGDMEHWHRIKDEYPDLYRLAKILNFALIYGGEAWTLCNKLGLDPRVEKNIRRCERYAENWFKGYPEIVALQEWAIQHGYEHGWVPTIAGRRQHVGVGLASFDDRIRKHWENKCTNSVIQGSAADILQVAMVSIANDEELRRMKYVMLNQIYDELVGEAPARYAKICAAKVAQHMEAPFAKKMSVKLVAEAGTGSTWGSAKP